MRPEGPTDVTRDDLIQALDRAVDGLISWCTDWHAALITESRGNGEDAARHLRPFEAWFTAHCNNPIVDQPSVKSLLELSTRIQDAASRNAAAARPVNDADYRSMMSDVRAFIEQSRRLERAFAAASSDLDSLTGIQNRYAMHRALAHEHDRLSRSSTQSFVALVDLDHFKAVNDRHGHAAGDAALVHTAGLLAQGVRSYDQVFRFGGEEFLILISDADEQTVKSVLDRLRQTLEQTSIRVSADLELEVTASFGAAPLQHEQNVETTLERADQALYAAKSAGRNRVILADAL